MYHLIILALAFALSASALVVPRATQPADWDTALLEPYNTYHTRYLALGCNLKHNTDFFNQCCHPLLATASLSSLPAQCTPSTKVSAAVPSDDDGDDCDDGDDTSSTPSPVPSQAPAAPATQSTPAPAPAETPAPKKTAPAASQPAASSSVNTGGFATFFYQNGVAGACGTVHKDTDIIAAIDADRYGNTGQVSSLCGKQVIITNTQNQKSVTATIVDACPTCDNSNSIDLSVGAFQEIASLSQGIVPISWTFAN